MWNFEDRLSLWPFIFVTTGVPGVVHYDLRLWILLCSGVQMSRLYIYKYRNQIIMLYLSNVNIYK